MNLKYLPHKKRNNLGRFIKGQISPNRFGVHRICPQCEKKFYLQQYRIKDNTRGKYCSQHCGYLSNRGKRNSLKTEIKKGQYENEKHPQWMGKKVGYYALHTWLRRNYQLSEYCDFCGNFNVKIVWANLTGIYDRGRKNWANLCHSCHIKFDKVFPKNPKLKGCKYKRK